MSTDAYIIPITGERCVVIQKNVLCNQRLENYQLNSFEESTSYNICVIKAETMMTNAYITNISEERRYWCVVIAVSAKLPAVLLDMTHWHPAWFAYVMKCQLPWMKRDNTIATVR